MSKVRLCLRDVGELDQIEFPLVCSFGEETFPVFNSTKCSPKWRTPSVVIFTPVSEKKFAGLKAELKVGLKAG